MNYTIFLPVSPSCKDRNSAGAVICTHTVQIHIELVGIRPIHSRTASPMGRDSFFFWGMNAMEICRIPSRILVKRLTNTTGSSSPANVPRSCYPRTKWLPGINGSRDSLSWDRMTPRNCCPRTEWLPGIDGSRESLSWDQMIPRNYCPRTKWLPAISSLIQGFGINGYLSDSQEVFPGKPYLIDINLPR